MATKKERLYLTAVGIESGIIMLIDENGYIAYYRQRGIQRIPEETRKVLIATGLLKKNWMSYPELPKHISISYEDTYIMGIARASYPAELINAITPQMKKKYLES